MIIDAIKRNDIDASYKHAYLIMAHHRLDLLEFLIDAIDDERNDIFLHVDIKSKDINYSRLVSNYSNLFYLQQMDVRWGGYSQVACEYELLKSATSIGQYKYYHLLTGATYPLKNQDEIHRFFDINQGKEFVGFDNRRDFSFRAKYYFFMPESGKLIGLKGKAIQLVRRILLSAQEMLRFDHCKKYGLVIKKGVVYWSITDELARYIISMEKTIHDMLKNSISGDEIFVQTLVYNSTFYKSVYDCVDELNGSARGVAWDELVGGHRPEHSFIMQDYDMLIKNNWCFALKFEGQDGVKLIEKIKKGYD